MLTDEEEISLFDGLLLNALTLAAALQEQVTTGGFSELRTAWKDVHAVRSLRLAEVAEAGKS